MAVDKRTGLGFGNENPGDRNTKRIREFINLKLAAQGAPIVGTVEDYPYLELGGSLLANLREKNRILRDYLCPADQRIQDYLADTFRDEAKDR